MTKTRAKRTPPAKRVDVTRMEYQNLLDVCQRHADALKRLHDNMAIQFRRTGEIRQELDEFKRLVIGTRSK